MLVPNIAFIAEKMAELVQRETGCRVSAKDLCIDIANSYEHAQKLSRYPSTWQEGCVVFCGLTPYTVLVLAAGRYSQRNPQCAASTDSLGETPINPSTV